MSERRQDVRPLVLTRKQTALIHLARKKLGLSDERYRLILWEMAGVETSKNLDQTGFELVMKAMMALGFRSAFTKTFYSHRPGMATPAQVTLIRTLWGKFATADGSERALNKWIERTFKVSALRFVTVDQADRAILALRSMINRERAKARPPSPSAEDIARWRYEIIRPVLDFLPRTRARVEAIEAAARIERTWPSGRRGPVAESTIRSWIADFERDAMAGLQPKARAGDGQGAA